jgi:hypothetical protein
MSGKAGQGSVPEMVASQHVKENVEGMSTSTWWQAQWQDLKSAFAVDGSLRDLYILDTTVEDWQRLLDFLASSGYPTRLTEHDETAPLPRRADDIPWATEDGVAVLEVDIGGPVLLCHFFSVDEIEFDFEPGEVTSPAHLAALVVFMQRVSSKMRKPIRLSPENESEIALLEYDPRTNSMTKG